LADGDNHGGKAVLDYLLAEIERLPGSVVFIFASDENVWKKYLRIIQDSRADSRTNTDSRIIPKPNSCKFCSIKYTSGTEETMSIEDGTDGLYMQIAAQRLSFSHDRDGFGNARAAENLLPACTKRKTNKQFESRRKDPQALK